MTRKLIPLALLALGACSGAPRGGCPAGAVWVKATWRGDACVPTMRWADSVARAHTPPDTTTPRPR